MVFGARRACRQQHGHWVNGGRAVGVITAIKTTSETDQGLAARNIGMFYSRQGRPAGRLVRREWSKRRYDCTSALYYSVQQLLPRVWPQLEPALRGGVPSFVCMAVSLPFHFRVFTSIRRRRNYCHCRCYYYIDRGLAVCLHLRPISYYIMGKINDR